jgi:hypothetical protein
MVEREIRYIYPEDEVVQEIVFVPDEEYGPRFLAIETGRLHGALSVGFSVAAPLEGVYIPVYRPRRR